MIYLIRHGQAGPRGNYDELSALGQQQAQLLGRHLGENDPATAEIYTGTLQRQQTTAQLVQEQLSASPQVITDERWNEFQLGAVYQSIAQHLCEESETFARDYGEMKLLLSQNAYTMSGAVSRCDRAVMKAWLLNRYLADDYEAWPDFQQRVRSVFAELTQHSPQENIAIFTSATPIAVVVGTALQLVDEKTLELAWVMYNTGLTSLKYRDTACTLYTLNATPHLFEEAMKTFR